MAIFNEDKYQAALEALAEQIVAMVREDEGDMRDLEDYIADAQCEILERAKQLFKKKGRK